jgi:DNA-binding transcriptional regulator YiaG
MANQYKANRREWDSERIRALRRHLGLTQRELADRLGTRQQTISEWETGLYKPRGASSTLLSIVAERAKFEYRADPGESKSS